jgi:hypothetical protein
MVVPGNVLSEPLPAADLKNLLRPRKLLQCWRDHFFADPLLQPLDGRRRRGDRNIAPHLGG